MLFVDMNKTTINAGKGGKAELEEKQGRVKVRITLNNKKGTCEGPQVIVREFDDFEYAEGYAVIYLYLNAAR